MLAILAERSEQLQMPYIFPYENVFLLGIATLIVALLIYRFRVVRRRRRDQEASERVDS